MDITLLDQLLQQAETAVANNHIWQAVDLYTAVLQQVGPQITDPDPKEKRLIALRERGYLLSLLGEPIAALAAYEQYYLEAGNSKHTVEALIRIGNGTRALSRYQDSLQAYHEAMELAEALNYTPGRAFVFAGLGGTLWALGRSEEAVVNLRKAIALFEQLNHLNGQLQAFNQLGIVYGDKGQLDKAIDAFQSSLALCRQSGRPDGLAIALNNLGECHQLLFDLDQAVYYHREALEMCETGQLRRVEADICRNLGLDLSYLGKQEEAIVYLHRALAVSHETSNQEIELQTQYALAVTEGARGEWETAENHATILKETAETINSRAHLAHAFHALGLCAQYKGDTAKSAEWWQQAVFLAHETEKHILLWKLHSALATIAPSPGLSQVHYRIASEVIHQIAYPLEDRTLRQKFLDAPPIHDILQRIADHK